MINLTKNIVMINKNLSYIDLGKSIIEVKSDLTNYYNLKDDFNINDKKYCFLNIIENNLKDIKITENFLNELLEFTLDKTAPDFLRKYNLINNYKLLEKPFLMSYLKLIILNLWKNKKILIPVRFNLIGNILTPELVDKYKFSNKIMIDIKNSFELKKEKLSENNSSNYLNRAFRIICATDYDTEKDISFKELNDLHIKLMEAKSSESDILSAGVKLKFETFINELNNLYSLKDFSFNNYESWAIGYKKRYKRMDYFEYINSLDDLKERRREYNIKDTIERNKKKNKLKKLDKLKEKNVPVLIDYSIENRFVDIVKNQTSWIKSIPYFENINMEKIEKDSKNWIVLKDAYIENRQRNGYESTKSFISGYNFLLNYIYFYLNGWNEENPENKVDIPNSPKDFHRTIYFNNTFVSSKVSERPFTVMELLNYMYDSSSSKNIKIRSIQSFFKFIEDFYFDDKNIWNENFSNPIRENDYLRVNKNKKTNKVIIPKDVYINLKKYLYSIEFFGEYLFEKVLENPNFVDFDLAKENFIDTEKLGFVPVFFEKNKCYPLLSVYNTFLYKKRLIEIDGEMKEKYIPSNTIIRAFILMLNTGLRSAQVKWLDKTNWNLDDKENIQAYYKIKVNTDKTHNEWITYVPQQTYQSLLKETEFQNLLKEDFVNTLVNYQNRDFTRFEDINCLFKSDSDKGLPVEITRYWADILWSFQNTLNNINEEQCQLIYFNQEEVNIRRSVEGLEYCELRAYAVHTPHSMRATFCTHMAEYLERNEIAALVGHSSSLITSEVYIKPEDSTIKDKMERANNIFENSVNSDYFNKDSVAHIKPNLNQSSLQKAFLKDRDQTIELFNIISISMNINKDSEEQSKKAINLLKNARMDHVVFETTHICPVGGICPQEVMGIIGDKRRCGLCPLALKCIDNLNPIYAKQRDLIREIKEGKEKLDKAIKSKESNITINNIEDKVNLDIRELVSWKFSADILSKHYENIKDNKDLEKKYYVEMPDMVKNHLEKVSVSNEKEYLLTRIADANAYSIYNTNEIKYQSEMIKRGVIKNLGLFEYDDYYVSDDEKVETFCAMIHNMMQSNGVELNKLVEYDCFKAIDNQKVKIKNLGFNTPIKLENKKVNI